MSLSQIKIKWRWIHTKLRTNCVNPSNEWWISLFWLRNSFVVVVVAENCTAYYLFCKAWIKYELAGSGFGFAMVQHKVVIPNEFVYNESHFSIFIAQYETYNNTNKYGRMKKTTSNPSKMINVNVSTKNWTRINRCNWIQFIKPARGKFVVEKRANSTT